MEANQLPHQRKGNCVSVVLITLTKESTNNKYNIIYCLFNARPLGGTTTPLKTSKRIKVSALCNQCSCNMLRYNLIEDTLHGCPISSQTQIQGCH